MASDDELPDVARILAGILRGVRRQSGPVSHGGNEDEYRWNCTEVYRRDDDRWRIVQTHWSFTKVGT